MARTGPSVDLAGPAACLPNSAQEEKWDWVVWTWCPTARGLTEQPQCFASPLPFLNCSFLCFPWFCLSERRGVSYWGGGKGVLYVRKYNITPLCIILNLLSQLSPSMADFHTKWHWKILTYCHAGHCHKLLNISNLSDLHWVNVLLLPQLWIPGLNQQTVISIGPCSLNWHAFRNVLLLLQGCASLHFGTRPVVHNR